ncbi:hypothetical protein [Desulfoplanes sp.]
MSNVFPKSNNGRSQDTDSLCLAAGRQHIVVLPGKKTEFTRALEAMGCILPVLQG